MKLTYDEMKSLMVEKLLKYGVERTLAERCAENLATSSRDGVLSHGFYRFHRLVTMIRSGAVKPNERPVCRKSFGAFEIWDGRLGMGNTNAEDAMARAIELAGQYGIGCIALGNTNHWMRGGAFGIQAAEAGCAGICWTNTMPNMPPWGARNCVIGNNPLVMSVPYKGGAVFTDSAMSQFSYGALDKAKLQGRTLSVPGGYDSEGNLSTDPAEIVKVNRVVPTGFWKGSSFSILMDMMASSLSEGEAVCDVGKHGGTSLTEYGVCQMFIAIRTDDESNTDATVSRVIESIKNAVPVEEGGEVYYPSERLLSIRKKSLEEGIDVSDDAYAEVMAL